MKIVLNNERIGILILKGGYRAWWIKYSNGLQCLSNGKYKNLWCLPKFEHYNINKKATDEHYIPLKREEEMIWTRQDGIIFDAFCVCLRGLKNGGWISLQEHEKILNIIQDNINKKATDDKTI